MTPPEQACSSDQTDQGTCEVVAKTEEQSQDLYESIFAYEGTGLLSGDPSDAVHDGVVPKRKGGRKAIYATLEERKHRNRQAQAAFRERRTDYIKQLENTIEHHEDVISSLRRANNVCSEDSAKLLHKVTQLNRILQDKGYDAEAEVAAMGSSAGIPNSQPSYMQHSLLADGLPVQIGSRSSTSTPRIAHTALRNQDDGPYAITSDYDDAMMMDHQPSLVQSMMPANNPCQPSHMSPDLSRSQSAVSHVPPRSTPIAVSTIPMPAGSTSDYMYLNDQHAFNTSYGTIYPAQPTLERNVQPSREYYSFI